MTEAAASVARPASAQGDALADLCGQVAAAFKRKWGRGPLKTSARWAGPNMLVVMMVNGHTEAEKTMRAAGHIQQLLEGRQLLQTTLQEELQDIVHVATGRDIVTTLSATRLDPDLSAEIFILEDEDTGDADSLAHAVREVRGRARELEEEAEGP